MRRGSKLMTAIEARAMSDAANEIDNTIPIIETIKTAAEQKLYSVEVAASIMTARTTLRLRRLKYKFHINSKSLYSPTRTYTIFW